MDILVTIFYQPFLNALILVYAGLEHIMNNPDMGIAVIVFTVGVRILLLPLTIASTESEEEQMRIGRKFDRMRADLESSQPLKYKEARAKLVKDHKKTVRFEMLNIAIQLGIAIILWVVFDKGLSGAHDHLVYSWMPAVQQPYNLMFLGSIDLSQPSLIMNITTALALFTVETISIGFAPMPATSQDRMIQYLLPIITFLYLFGMPAGKKLFIITTILISILFIFIRETRHAFKVMGEANQKRSYSSK